MKINHRVTVLGLSFAASLLSGCWKTVMVDNQKVYEAGWQKAQADLRRRAAFEMPCTEPEIQMTLIETNQSNIPPLPWSIGATGCGKRMTYKMVYGSGWVLNSRTDVNTASTTPAPNSRPM
jgi:hypothetical protein